jgi:hypothetical protein
MTDHSEDFMQQETLDRIAEKLEALMRDDQLSILQKLQERKIGSRRISQSQYPSRPYF